MSGYNIFELRQQRDELSGYARGLETAIEGIRKVFPIPRDAHTQALLEVLEQGAKEAREDSEKRQGDMQRLAEQIKADWREIGARFAENRT